MVNVTVWSGYPFKKLAYLNDFTTLKIVDAHNAISGIDLTVPYGHPKTGVLSKPGNRILVEHNGTVWSGPILDIEWEGPGPGKNVIFKCEDDLRVLWTTLAWPVPKAALTGQSAAEYDHRTGPAETVLKGYLIDNLGRLGLLDRYTVAPDKARGTAITVDMRMHQLSERLLPAVDAVGLGVQAAHDVATGKIIIDVYQGRTNLPALTPESGVLLDAKLKRSSPSATRVVGGGQGEGTARVFKSAVSAALETEWSDVVEAFADARDAETDDKLTQRVAEKLAEGVPKSGISLTLSETANFRYPAAFRKGDKPTLRMGGLEVSDIIRSAEIVWNGPDRMAITPKIGDRNDDPTEAIRRVVQKIISDLRNKN